MHAQDLNMCCLACAQADRDKQEAGQRAEREKKEAEDATARQLVEQAAAASAKEADLKSRLQQKEQVKRHLLVLALLPACVTANTTRNTHSVPCKLECVMLQEPQHVDHVCAYLVQFRQLVAYKCL